MIHYHTDFITCITEARNFSKNEFYIHGHRSKVICIATASHIHFLFPESKNRKIYQIAIYDAYRSIMNSSHNEQQLYLPIIGIKCRNTKYQMPVSVVACREALAKVIGGKN
jgi:hypothetical protein